MLNVRITRNNRRAVLTLRCEDCGAYAERPSELFAQAWADRHECSISTCAICGENYDASIWATCPFCKGVIQRES